ncbi:MAG TPA: acetyl-CoA carboxylase biotin carboxyl carrier protein [Terracidiphilus sp.]|nr:acetyl-CoA carboxylase biotin carboxyl carrier protein [Terracidiphilus sp.]
MKQQDIDDLRQLVDFLKAHGVSEFDLDRGDLKIRLKFHEPAGAAANLNDLARLLATAPAAAAPAPGHAAAPSAAPEASAPAADPDAGLHIIKSPIVGTFYGSPSPGAPPFVNIGDHVEKNQVVCIIEAMKLMNEVDSDAAGTVVKCFVTNGQPVEFGQPLFAIRLD